MNSENNKISEKDLKLLEEDILKAEKLTSKILFGNTKDLAKLELSNEDKEILSTLLDNKFKVWRENHIKDYKKKEVWENIERVVAALERLDSSKLNSPKQFHLKDSLSEKSEKRSLINNKFQRQKSYRNNRKILSALVSIAALILIIFGILILASKEKPIENVITPGKSIAYLEIGNKDKIPLDIKDTVIINNAEKILVDSGKIQYSENSIDIKREYHTIIVPKHGEYNVRLSDGTNVWLNSDTKLKYLPKFSKNKRIVELSGEAYFEVVKDNNRPFIVKTEKMDMIVLGTHFNINAYPENKNTIATLNEGKIQIISANISEILIPNQQFIVNNETGEYHKRKVNANIYSSWVNGCFVFKDERLEDILDAVSRWYDIAVFYTNPDYKDIRYSMNINKYKDIKDLLICMEHTNSVHFKVSKHTLIVQP
ncbi:MAG: FecR family protein [Bacilli bacterium]